MEETRIVVMIQKGRLGKMKDGTPSFTFDLHIRYIQGSHDRGLLDLYGCRVVFGYINPPQVFSPRTKKYSRMAHFYGDLYDNVRDQLLKDPVFLASGMELLPTADNPYYKT